MQLSWNSPSACSSFAINHHAHYHITPIYIWGPTWSLCTTWRVTAVLMHFCCTERASLELQAVVPVPVWVVITSLLRQFWRSADDVRALQLQPPFSTVVAALRLGMVAAKSSNVIMSCSMVAIYPYSLICVMYVCRRCMHERERKREREPGEKERLVREI